MKLSFDSNVSKWCKFEGFSTVQGKTLSEEEGYALFYSKVVCELLAHFGKSREMF